MCLEGRLLTPREALGIGIIHHLVVPEKLTSRVLDTAQRLSRRSPTAVRGIKTAIYQGGSQTLDRGLHTERVGFVAAVTDPSTRAAMREYVDAIEQATANGGMDRFLSDHLPEWLDGLAHDFSSTPERKDG